MTRLLFAVAAFALLAACSQADTNTVANTAAENASLAEANSSGVAATAAVTAVVTNSSATPMQKEQALALVKERHAGYVQIGKAMRAAKKGIDNNNLVAVRAAAGTVNTLAPKAAGWFPLGTGNEVVMPKGDKIEAKAEIWKQPDVFATDMKNFRQAAASFNQAAAGSDVAAMKAAHANLAGTCKSCHERFRAD